jgi:hypothetical protein
MCFWQSKIAEELIQKRLKITKPPNIQNAIFLKHRGVGFLFLKIILVFAGVKGNLLSKF